jgi:outer membrane lipoprotein-sorting protein
MRRRSAIFILLASSFLAHPTAASRADEPTPREILGRAERAYATCKTYKDSGFVRTVILPKEGENVVSEKPFTTAFVRPDRLRFEYKETKPQGHAMRYLIRMQGEEVVSWWDIRPGVTTEESLPLALAKATGVSGGSAHIVPSLLLPDGRLGARATDLKEPKRIADDRQDGVDCFRVEGRFGNATRTLWIAKDTSLLRRVDQTMQAADLHIVSTTIYEASAGDEISPKLLEFDPPK